MNLTELKFNSDDYPILFEQFKDDNEPFDMTSFVSFNDEGPDITNETLKQLNEEQLFKRELVIALAKKAFW